MLSSRISSQFYPEHGIAVATISNHSDCQGELTPRHVNQDHHFAVRLPEVSAPDLQRMLTEFIVLLQCLINEENGGSTLVLAAILESEILFVNIGDSMGVHYGSDVLTVKHELTPHVPGLDPAYSEDVIIDCVDSEREALVELVTNEFPEFVIIDQADESSNFLLSFYQEMSDEARQRTLSELRARLEDCFPGMVVMRTETGYMPSRSLGDEKRLAHDPDFECRAYGEGDVLLLATDGLSDALSVPEIATSLQGYFKDGPLKNASCAVRLVNTAMKESCAREGHADDITALVMQACPFTLVGVMDGHDVLGHVVSRFLAAAFEAVFPSFVVLKIQEQDAVSDDKRRQALNNMQAAVHALLPRLEAWREAMVSSWFECAHDLRTSGYTRVDVADNCLRVWAKLWLLVEGIAQKKSSEALLFETSTAFCPGAVHPEAAAAAKEFIPGTLKTA